MLSVTVARAGRIALRVEFNDAVREDVPVVVRAIWFVDVVRAVVADFVARAVVALRDAVRFVDVVRATVLDAVLRAVVFFCVAVDDFSDWRFMVFFVSERDVEFGSRTAASAMPAPIINAVMNSMVFLIR